MSIVDKIIEHNDRVIHEGMIEASVEIVNRKLYRELEAKNPEKYKEVRAKVTGLLLEALREVE